MYKYKKLPDQIIEKLYLGDMDHANNIDGLLKLKISHILCSAIHLPLNYPDVIIFFYLRNLLTKGSILKILLMKTSRCTSKKLINSLKKDCPQEQEYLFTGIP